MWTVRALRIGGLLLVSLPLTVAEVVVVSAEGEWQILSSVDLQDEIWATPAIDDGRLFVRTRGKLYGFGGAEAAADGR